MASYKETFSAYYDALTEDVDRAVIADRCEELLAQYHPKQELALDLCCGTGTLATELARRGFEVIGVDASPEMLMQAAHSIINCGDASQEGELIQRWVMQKAQAKCPVKRLWISSAGTAGPVWYGGPGSVHTG